VLPLIGGMLILIGGLSVTPSCSSHPWPAKPIFMPLRRLNGKLACQREAEQSSSGINGHQIPVIKGSKNVKFRSIKSNFRGPRVQIPLIKGIATMILRTFIAAGIPSFMPERLDPRPFDAVYLRTNPYAYPIRTT
jgi:hypothetical protein